MKRKIGLDVGDKTIGLALSDELGMTAQGFMTYERVNIRKDTDVLIDLIRRYDCDTVVIGLPLNLDGTDSQQTEKVRAFRTKLENKMRSKALAHIPIEWEDERFTTVIAEDALLRSGLSRQERKKVIDKQAAVVILQDWLAAFVRRNER